MADWLDGATRDGISSVGTASFEWEAEPSWKLLLHTTEGGSYVSAKGAYINNGFAPNVTVGPHPSRSQTVHAWQHLPFDSRSTTLADDPGGTRTNRDYVIQVEIVGYADLDYARRFGDEWLHVDHWPDWYKTGVAEWLNAILDVRPIPRRCTVRWVDYPASYGEGASQRLSSAEYDAYEGILGHQHAPENSHGDPGDLGDFVRDYLLEDDMQLTDHAKLTAGEIERGHYEGLESLSVRSLLVHAAIGGRRTSLEVVPALASLASAVETLLAEVDLTPDVEAEVRELLQSAKFSGSLTIDTDAAELAEAERQQ